MTQQARKTSNGSVIPIVLLVSILVCALIVLIALIALLGFDAYTDAFTKPQPCIDGGPGSPAVFQNADLQLFTFPKSATHIESSCYTWQGATIYIWFDTDPSEINEFVNSTTWDVGKLSAANSSPSFGNQRPNAKYLYARHTESQEGMEVWVDTSAFPYRVFVYVYLA